MTISTQTKEATKTALAMTIAYGIALSLDWDRPYWAGFAVAFCSLATIGQSLNKAALRMLGTFLAIAASFTFIAWFAQERWAFFTTLSVYGAMCTYLMSGSRHAYFWQVGWFVCCVVCMDSGPDPVNAFTTGVLRAQETGLGLLVYSLVAIFVWPSSSRIRFIGAAETLATKQQQLFSAYMNVMRPHGAADEARDANASEVQAKAAFDQLLQAAEMDSSDVAERRLQWRHYQTVATGFAKSAEGWRETFTDLDELDIEPLFPGIDAFSDELDKRLGQIGDALAGRSLAAAPQSAELSFNRDALHQLSHFQRAAVAVARGRLQDLDRLSRSLVAAANDIREGTTTSTPLEPSPHAAVAFIPDPDRLANALRLFTIMWAGFLAVIYVGDIPGGTGVVSMSGSLGIAFANMPQTPISKLFAPVTVGLLFAAILYLFIMPHLTSYIGLGLMIFAATFAICYLYAAPQRSLGRTLGLVLFLVIASISNEQTYSFLSVAVTAQMFAIILFIFVVTVYFPFCFIPDRVFVRLLGRYFRSSAYLISKSQPNQAPANGRFACWRRAFHEREVATLPAKLRSWAPHISSAALSNTTPEHIDTLLNALQSLTFRIQQSLQERETPQAPLLVEALRDDWLVWQVRLDDAFRRVAHDTDLANMPETLRDRLESGLKQLESRIEDVLNEAPTGQISDEQAEDFYRLLDATRGVSKSLIDYEANAGDIDWVRWREERFA